MATFAARVDSIASNLALFVLPGFTVQLAAREINGKRMINRFYNGTQLADMAAQALRWEEEGAQTLYFTANPLRGDIAESRRFANDGDVMLRTFAMFDVEAIEHSNGLSATDPEREAAWDVLTRLRGTLEAAGCVGEIVCDSGNGWHNFIPLDMPNDDGSKSAIKTLLKGLNERCSDERAHVDTDTYNAVRAAKVYGCLNRKGENTEERPHRYTQLIEGTPWNLDNAQRNTEALRRLLASWQMAEDRAKGPKRQPVSAPERAAARGSLYAQAALDSEVRAVAGAEPGSRNRQLNQSAFAIGQLVGAGVMPRETAESALSGAARSIGLEESEIRGTLRSGMEAGIAQPRQIPETNGYHRPGPGPGPGPAAASASGQETVYGTAAPHQAAETPAPGSTPAAAAEPEWETPIPLDAPPAAPPFPLDIFPLTLRRYVEECAWATNTPIDFTAVPMLALAGGAIGNSRRLSIKSSHHQSACLFAGIVGSPGTGKSIPLEFLAEPFEQSERELRRDFDIALALWEEGDARSRGPKPTMQRRLLDDTTAEALARILADNARGLIMVRDELAALVTGLNQYKEGGKGNDRQVYLKLWNHGTIRVDRNKQEGIPLVVHRPFSGIVGAIQPDVVQTMRNAAEQGKKVMDDGLMDRFLFSYPDVPPAIGERWREISMTARESWDATVRELLALPMERRDEDEYPRLVFLTDDGKSAWVRETDRHADEINAPEFLEWKRGPFAKFVGYSARLALIIQLLRYVTGEASSENVDGESMARAWQLVDYFKSHSQKLLILMGGDPRVAEARKVLNWIIRTEKTTFTRRDAYSDLRHAFAAPEALEAPLRLLVEHRFLVPRPEGERGRGRKPTPRYDVSPLARHRIPEIHEMGAT